MVHKTQQCALIKCLCGFTGNVAPNWRIIKRRNGAAVSEIISVAEIINNTNDGLECYPITDLDNVNNSVLRVGPVGRADDQSSYQCIFELY